MRPEIRLGVFMLRAARRCEVLRLTGSKISLKNDDVRLVQLVVVGIDCLGKEFFSGSILDVNLRQVTLAQRSNVGGGKLDRLARSRELQHVDGFDR